MSRISAAELFPSLLADRSEDERRMWSRWVMGSHSDEFIPEMLAAVLELDRQDPVSLGRPISNPGPRSDDCIVVASNRGRHCFIWDFQLKCRVILFDFTGDGILPGSNPFGWEEVSSPCRGKGEVLEFCFQNLGLPGCDQFIGVIDDDVVVRSSDVVALLGIARIHGLSALQPSIPLNTVLSNEYGFLRQRPSISLHRVPLVEILAPFVRADLFSLAMGFGKGILSSYGLDRFALPVCAAHLGCWRFAAVDSIQLEHVRPLRTLQKTYDHGLSSKQEELLVRLRLMIAMGCPVDESSYFALESAVASDRCSVFRANA